jgi:hypothetical protein
VGERAPRASGGLSALADTLSIEYLKQWEEHGAMWRAVEVVEDHAVVDLCTCFGEPVDRLETSDAQVVDYVRSRRRSD